MNRLSYLPAIALLAVLLTVPGEARSAQVQVPFSVVGGSLQLTDARLVSVIAGEERVNFLLPTIKVTGAEPGLVVFGKGSNDVERDSTGAALRTLRTVYRKVNQRYSEAGLNPPSVPQSIHDEEVEDYTGTTSDHPELSGMSEANAIITRITPSEDQVGREFSLRPFKWNGEAEPFSSLQSSISKPGLTTLLISNQPISPGSDARSEFLNQSIASSDLSGVDMERFSALSDSVLASLLKTPAGPSFEFVTTVEMERLPEPEGPPPWWLIALEVIGVILAGWMIWVFFKKWREAGNLLNQE